LPKKEILLGWDRDITFLFEGKCVKNKLIGIEKLRKQVDSLVINNNKLREYTGILVSKQDFQKQMKFWQPQEVLLK
jgi:cell division GTPase FtsZ